MTSDTSRSQEQPTRTSLVTGGTDGIGRAVATRLAAAGDRVLVTGRDPARGQQVLDKLGQLNPRAEHAYLPADLALLSETARLAGAVLERTDPVDAVVCCAGVFSLVPEWTDEGLERALVVNYLSRYLLGRLLLPALSRSPSGRLVLVANAGRYRDSLDFDDLQHRRGKPGLVVAARTQFANDLWAVELSQRLQDSRVEVTCVFPGVVKTSLFQHATGLPRVARRLAPLVVALLGRSADTAADTPAWLAHDEQAVGSGGRFYGARRRPLRVPERARRRDRRRQLWTASEDLVRGYLPPDLEPGAARWDGSAEQSAGTLWS